MQSSCYICYEPIYIHVVKSSNFYRARYIIDSYGTVKAEKSKLFIIIVISGFNIDESKVLGGEACLWAEYIDNENLMTTLW